MARDGWLRRQLLRQIQIARRVDHVIRAHAWIRGVGNLQGAQSVRLAESPPFWIRRLIAAKREATVSKFSEVPQPVRLCSGAMVIGWDDEMTVQCEGIADIPTGVDRDRCLRAYFGQYPDGVERAIDPDIVHVRVRPSWLRYSDYRPGSCTVEETTLGN